MSYREIIKAAFWITLRNRFLWFFGFFAGGTSVSANFNVPPSTFGGFDGEDFGDPGGGVSGGTTPAPGLDPGQWILDNLALILVVAAVVVLIMLLFLVMSLIS
jgi:hypothetical protein